MRAIDMPVEIDFMSVSSYGASTQSSGVVRIRKDIDTDITGRTCWWWKTSWIAA
jgi:hypoxanthine phosphoribosyltransferase